jgi:hypothetical protein
MALSNNTLDVPRFHQHTPMNLDVIKCRRWIPPRLIIKTDGEIPEINPRLADIIWMEIKSKYIRMWISMEELDS